MTGQGRVRPAISFDDDAPAPVAPPSRRIDREAAQAVAEKHGFNRSLTAEAAAPPPAPTVVERLDGRSLRRTGRTTQMNAKVREEVRVRFIQLAQARGNVSLGQLLEEAIVLLEEKHRRG